MYNAGILYNSLAIIKIPGQCMKYYMFYFTVFYRSENKEDLPIWLLLFNSNCLYMHISANTNCSYKSYKIKCVIKYIGNKN